MQTTKAFKKHIKEPGIDKTDFLENTILNKFLPKYTPLRQEAKVLLNSLTNEHPDSQGPDSKFIRQALSNAVCWLRDNCHLKDCAPLHEIITYFLSSPYQGGILTSNLMEKDREIIEKTRRKLKEIDPSYNDFLIGPGALARDVLKYWEKMWDLDISYECFMTVICNEALAKDCNIDEIKAILLLRGLEEQVIYETLVDKEIVKGKSL